MIPSIATVDLDAKLIKQFVEDSKPKSIIVAKDGSVHSSNTMTLTELIEDSETANKTGWSDKYRGNNVSSKWLQKDKTIYTATDSETSKDIDLSKVSLEVVG